MSSPTLLPFQPLAMTPAQLAAASYLARYSRRTHNLYAFRGSLVIMCLLVSMGDDTLMPCWAVHADAGFRASSSHGT